MHHVRSSSAVQRFRLAALLFFVICLIAPIAVGMLLGSILTADPDTALVGSGLMGLCLVMAIPQWAAGSRTGCPLCWTPVLARKACAKHRRARTFMGSHRLRVALAILFRNQFRCPYCNEPTALERPDSLRHSGSRWSQPD